MPTFKAKVAKDGSVILPAELRERLDIQPESEVEFFLTDDGQIHFHHLTDRFSDFGFRVMNPPVSIREIDDRIADVIAEKNERSLSTSRLSRKPAAE